MKTITDKIVKDKKQAYIKGIKKKASESNNTKIYYDAIKLLRDGERPEPWDEGTIFPGKTDEEIGELCADYFNGISTD